MATTPAPKKDKTAAEKKTGGVATTSSSAAAALKLTPEAQARLEKFLDPEFWLKDKVNEDTGEIKRVPRFRYLEGKPRGYRADMKNGSVNIEGITPVPGKTFTMQPVAYVFFEAEILGQKRRNYAEVYFFDAENNLSVMMFHGYTVDELLKLESELYYTDKSLTEVLLTVSFTPKEGLDSEGKKTKYYIGAFEQTPAPDKEKTKELQYWASKARIYRKETATETAVIKARENYFDPYHDEVATEAETSAEETE